MPSRLGHAGKNDSNPRRVVILATTIRAGWLCSSAWSRQLHCGTVDTALHADQITTCSRQRERVTFCDVKHLTRQEAIGDLQIRIALINPSEQASERSDCKSMRPNQSCLVI